MLRSRFQNVFFRADLFVWPTLPASLAPADRRQSSVQGYFVTRRFLAIVNIKKQWRNREFFGLQSDSTRQSIVLVYACVRGLLVVFVDHFLWKTVTIEEDTFSIPFRKTKYKTDTPRFRFASSEVIPKFGRSFGQEVSTIIVNTLKYDYYADYYIRELRWRFAVLRVCCSID